MSTDKLKARKLYMSRHLTPKSDKTELTALHRRFDGKHVCHLTIMEGTGRCAVGNGSVYLSPSGKSGVRAAAPRRVAADDDDGDNLLPWCVCDVTRKGLWTSPSSWKRGATDSPRVQGRSRDPPTLPYPTSRA